MIIKMIIKDFLQQFSQNLDNSSKLQSGRHLVIIQGLKEYLLQSLQTKSIPKHLTGGQSYCVLSYSLAHHSTARNEILNDGKDLHLRNNIGKTS